MPDAKYTVNIHTGVETPHKPKHRVRARLTLDYEFDWEYGLDAARNNVEERHIYNQFVEAVRYGESRYGGEDASYWCGCRNHPDCGHAVFNTEMLGVVEDDVLVPIAWDEHDPSDDIAWPDFGVVYSACRTTPAHWRSVGQAAKDIAGHYGVDVEWSDSVTPGMFFSSTSPTKRVICHESHRDDGPHAETRGGYSDIGSVQSRRSFGRITIDPSKLLPNDD